MLRCVHLSTFVIFLSKKGSFIFMREEYEQVISIKKWDQSESNLTKYKINYNLKEKLN